MSIPSDWPDHVPPSTPPGCGRSAPITYEEYDNDHRPVPLPDSFDKAHQVATNVLKKDDKAGK